MDEDEQVEHIDLSPAAPAATPYELVVVQPFAGRLIGEVITDAREVLSLLESEWAQHVVKRTKA